MVGVTGWRGSQLPKRICLGVLLAAMVCGEYAPWAHGEWVPAGDAAFVGWLKLKQPRWRQWLSEGMPLKVLLGLPVIPPPMSTQNDLRPPPGHTPSTVMSCSRAHGLNVTKFHTKPLRCFFSGFDHSKCRSNSLSDCAVSLHVFSSPLNILPFCQRKTWFLCQAEHA